MAAYQTASWSVQPAASRRRNGTSGGPVELPVPPPSTAVRVVPRPEDGAGGPGARVLVTVRNSAEVEITRTIVAAIAHALWEARGEDHLTNWLDAEAVFNQLVPGASCKARPAPPRSLRAARDDDPVPVVLPRRARIRRP